MAIGLARSLARAAAAQQQAATKASNGFGPFQSSPQYGLALGGGTGLPRPDSTFQTQMGPLAPMLPYPLDRARQGEQFPEPRIYEYPVGVNLPTFPGDGKRIPFAQLRQYADLYDVARRAIELRKTELSSLTWDIVLDPDRMKELGRDAYATERAQLRQFWSQPDNNYFDLSAWLRAIMEDFLVIDAVSIYPVRARGKGWFGSGIAELRLIDSSTIKPILDITGGTPRPPDVAYQQYLWGVPRVDLAAFAAQPDPATDTGELVGEYTSAELLYLKMNPRTFTPYGFSNTEHAMITILTALKRKEWMLSYFDDGSVPALFVSMPEKADWTPDQIERREANLNATIAATMGGKWQIKFLPPGATPNPVKPPVLSDDFDQLLMQTICMCYDVTPAEMGFLPKSGLGGKGLGDSMENLQQRKSLIPSARLIERVFDRINHRLLGAPRDLLFRFNELEPAEDKERQANIDKIRISVGLKTIDEIREANGDEAFGLPETKVPIIITQTGPVALVEAIQRSQEPPAPPPGLAPSGGPPPATDDAEAPAGAKGPAKGGDMPQDAQDGAGEAQDQGKSLDIADEYRALGRFLATRQWRRGRPFVGTLLTEDQVATASASREGYAEVGKALGIGTREGE